MYIFQNKKGLVLFLPWVLFFVMFYLPSCKILHVLDVSSPRGCPCANLEAPLDSQCLIAFQVEVRGPDLPPICRVQCGLACHLMQTWSLGKSLTECNSGGLMASIRSKHIEHEHGLSRESQPWKGHLVLQLWVMGRDCLVDGMRTLVEHWLVVGVVAFP